MPQASRAIPALVLALSTVFVGAALAGAQTASFRTTHVDDPAHTSRRAIFQGLSRDGEVMLVCVLDTTNGGQASLAFADGTLTPVPNAAPPSRYSAYRLSGDGRTVVGLRDDFATSWTNGGAGVRLDDAGMARNFATAVSFDGTRVLGQAVISNAQKSVLWTAPDAYTVLDTGLNGGSVTSISGDGLSAAGSIQLSFSSRACRWDALGVRTDLETPAAFGTRASNALGISEDGRTVAGFYVHTVSSTTRIDACLWRDGVFRDLGAIPGVTGSENTSAISADGRVVVGLLSGGSESRLFIWDRFHGMRDLRAVLLGLGLGPELQGVTLKSVQAVSVLPSGAIVVGGAAIDANGIEQGYAATIPDEAAFDALGDLADGTFDSAATGLSADGETVVGYGQSATGKRAFVWTRDRGMFDIGPGALDARGVSGDGSVVAGTLTDSGYLWREDGTGRWLGEDARANAVAQAGNATVGSAIGPDGVRHAYRWNGDTTERYETYVAGHVAPSEAFACDADGSVFVGATAPHTAGGIDYLSRAFRWDSDGHQAYLGDLPGGSAESVATAISANGTIVGWSSSADGPEAFVWDQTHGMRGLGDLPGYGFASRANAVSPDGTVIVGMGVENGENRAFVYDVAHGRMLELGRLLVAKGAVEVAAWTLTEATGVTVDSATGRIVVSGYGIDPNGTKQAFRAVLPNLDAPLNY